MRLLFMKLIMVLVLEQVSSKQTVSRSANTMDRRKSHEHSPLSENTVIRAELDFSPDVYANSSATMPDSSNLTDTMSSPSAELDSGSTLLFPNHQLLLNRAKLLYSNRENKHSTGFVCCPTEYSLFQPISGVLIDGSIAQLYQNSKFTQSFVVGKCPTLRPSQRKKTKRMLRSRFRCHQQLTHTYAVFTRDGKQVLDYMRVPSHCTCVLYRNKNKRRTRHRHKTALQGSGRNSDKV